MATVVEQRVHRLLEHPFFVANDDFGCLELKQIFQPVIAVDDAAIQIVQVRGREPAAFQRHQRAEIRRNHRQHREHHPFRPAFGAEETLEQFDPLGNLLANLFAFRFRHRHLQLIDLFVQVHLGQRFAHRFGAHLGHERVRAVGLARLAVLHLAEQLVLFQRRVAGVDDEIILVVNDALQIARRHVEHQTDARRHAFEKPDVRDRHGQFNVAHAFASHPRERHFHAAPIADHAPMFDPFVFAAGAFPVLDRAENALAEQASLFRLERAVIDRLRVFDFPFGPGANRLGGSDADADIIHQVDRFQSQ